MRRLKKKLARINILTLEINSPYTTTIDDEIIKKIELSSSSKFKIKTREHSIFFCRIAIEDSLTFFIEKTNLTSVRKKKILIINSRDIHSSLEEAAYYYQQKPSKGQDLIIKLSINNAEDNTVVFINN